MTIAPRISCPIDAKHNVDYILGILAWHCPRCQHNGPITESDDGQSIRAIDSHPTTDEERTTWARFYGSVLVST